MAGYLQDDEEGQLKESVMDEFGVPQSETNDRRTISKDQRTQKASKKVARRQRGQEAKE